MLQRSLTENENIDHQYKERALLQLICHLENIDKKVVLEKIINNYKYHFL